MKAATDKLCKLGTFIQFQSTPPVKAATPQPLNRWTKLHKISIHAAREGGDNGYAGILVLIDISIHAAREGGDQIFSVVTPVMPISIHAAREGGDQFGRCECFRCAISIHAAREGGDH